MINSRKNAEAHYSVIGRSIHLQVDVGDLEKEDQLSMLRNLMQSTGTLDAIWRHADEKAIFKSIDEAWDAFRKS